jgi:hypothetical protein
MTNATGWDAIRASEGGASPHDPYSQALERQLSKSGVRSCLLLRASVRSPHVPPPAHQCH